MTMNTSTAAHRPGARPGPPERHSPDDVAAAAALLRAGAADRVTAIITGGGTKLGWGAPVTGPDIEISTARMNQLLSYHPGDLTVAVQGGMRLADLQPVLAEHGQWLALDPPSEDAGATVAGLLATGDAGPRRYRYGNLRDLAIGCTLALPDGTVAHAGGYVIKNVAGYDVTKLMHGSLGTLALIGEVILRLHPVPPASRTIGASLAPRAAIRAAVAVIGCGVEPTAVEWYGSPAGPGTLLVRLDGTARSADAATVHALNSLRAVGAPAEVLDDDEAARRWGTAAEPPPMADQPSGRCPTTLRIGTLPSHLPELAASLDRLGTEHEVTGWLTTSLGLGLHTVRLDGPIEGQAAVVDALGAVVERLDGTLALRDRDPALDQRRGTTAPLPHPPATVALQRAVKDRFDPDHRLGPGRFAPWF